MYERPIIAPSGLTELTDYDKDDEILVVRDGKVRRKSALVATPAFASRAAAEAASVPAVVMEISYPVTLKVSSGNAIRHVVRFVRDTGSLTAATGALVTADGQVWVPAGDPTPLHFGQDSMGVSSWTGSVPTPYLLSDVFASLGAAQAVYPEAAALTETVDSQAFQKCTDYIRSNRVLAHGGLENSLNSVNNAFGQVRIVIPQGVYYLNRTWDLTGIEFGFAAWNLHFEQATILGITPNKPLIDFMGSRNCQFTGVGIIDGLWTSAGICRMAMQFSIDNSRTSADCHSFNGARIHVKGRWKLAGAYNHSSEYMGFGSLGLIVSNDLDSRVRHCDFDGSDGTSFTANEEVTWAGSGSGFVKRVTGTTTGRIEIRVVSGTLADNTQITGQTSGKVADINGTPVAEPSGEGPDGRSYCLVMDGDNYWGVTSDYQTAPATDTAFSFLRCHGVLDLRHTGRGDALWICRAFYHDYTNSYFVSTDPDGGAAIVAFSNTSNSGLDGLVLDVHNESDMGDTDASTGLDYGVRFDAANAGANVVVSGWKWRRNKAQISLAQFFAGTNVTSVKIYGDIEVNEVGRDAGQVMFSDPAAFSVYGRLSCLADGTGPFFNVSSLADVGGDVFCDDRTSSNVRHASAQYRLIDADGNTEFINGFKIDGVDIHLEEGTFTPTLTDGTTSATLSSANGYYQRVGNWIRGTFRVVASDITGLAGGLYIGLGSLPDGSGVGSAGGGEITRAANLNMAGTTSLNTIVFNGDNRLTLQQFDATTGTTTLAASEITSTTELHGTFSYRVA